MFACLCVCAPLQWDCVSATDKSPPHAARQHRDMGRGGWEGDQSGVQRCGERNKGENYGGRDT